MMMNLNRKHFGLLAGGAVALIGTAATFMTFKRNLSLPKGAVPVMNFDAEKYLGKWYEIARFDFKFEKDIDNTTANYSLNEDGSIKVVNRGYNYVKEKWEEATAKAKFITNESIGRLKVSFFGPFYTSYNILSVDGDYEYALVVGKNTDYIWFLSRTLKMPDAIKAKYIALAESLEYDLSRLVWVEHNAEGVKVETEK